MGAILDWIMKLWYMQMSLNIGFQIQGKWKIYHMIVDYDELK